MASYTVTITLGTATLTALKAMNASLYALRAVTSANRSGAPAVWLRLTDYLQQINITWTDAAQAYLSTDPITLYATVTPGMWTDILPSQSATLNRDGSFTTGPSTLGGRFAVINTTTQSYTCGLAGPQPVKAPYCVFPLYGMSEVVITPTTLLFLMFAAQIFAPGTIIDQSFGSGLLIDAATTARQAQYDINLGWSSDEAGLATTYPPQTQLNPILIIPSPMLLT